ncbi:enoyl-CoA hydratase/isomerase family protein [Aquipuribacter sp. MA13-6]|uniref:enoyl-CoA hydratase/isomerase family protein n=1 Tax=unclassified Aquipuribacter TaxID=2635084 RepID=UPI003EED859D
MHVVLDGPRTLNAQTPDTWAALHAAADELPVGTRVVVLRGQGRAFSSGLDRSMMPVLAGLGTRPDAEVQEQIAGYQRAFTCWRRPGVLSVAAVAGPAVGAGFQLALACDLRVAADTATFRMAETSLGLVPDLAGTGPLVRAVGEAAALEICLTGRTVGAAEALRTGLVRAVVPTEELERATDDLVQAVLAAPAAATAATLDLLRDAGARTAVEQLERERATQARLLRGLARRPSTRASAGDAEGPGPVGR